MADQILTADALRAVIHYCPDTGVFTRKVRLAQRHQVGDRADTAVTGGGLKGYLRVSLFSERFLAHRLAWLYVYGVWPQKHIDHINGDKGDNRISNLREADDKLNAENMRNPRRSNKSGFLGVHAIGKSSWRARIQVDSKILHIGVYGSPEEAYSAYLSAKRKYHMGCTL